MFHYMGDYMSLGMQNENAVRNLCGHYLKRHINKFRKSTAAYFEGEGLDILAYLRRLMTKGVRADCMTLWLLAQQYTIHIGVFTRDGAWMTSIGMDIHQCTLIMIYVGGNDFLLLQRFEADVQRSLGRGKRTKSVPVKLLSAQEERAKNECLQIVQAENAAERARKLHEEKKVKEEHDKREADKVQEAENYQKKAEKEIEEAKKQSQEEEKCKVQQQEGERRRSARVREVSERSRESLQEELARSLKEKFNDWNKETLKSTATAAAVIKEVNGKKVSCVKCEKKFASEAKMLHHVSEEHKDVIYTCSHCSKDFGNYQHCVDHMKCHKQGKAKLGEEESPAIIPSQLRVSSRLLHRNRDAANETAVRKADANSSDSNDDGNGFTKTKEKIRDNLRRKMVEKSEEENQGKKKKSSATEEEKAPQETALRKERSRKAKHSASTQPSTSAAVTRSTSSPPSSSSSAAVTRSKSAPPSSSTGPQGEEQASEKRVTTPTRAKVPKSASSPKAPPPPPPPPPPHAAEKEGKKRRGGKGPKSSSSGKAPADKKRRQQLEVDLPKKHRCSKCGKKFAFPSRLATHMQSHSRAHPFKCSFPECGKSYKSKSQLTMHEKSHKKKKYACTQEKCDYVTFDYNKMRYHLAEEHAADDRYKCDQCNFTCKHRGSLKFHKANSH